MECMVFYLADGGDEFNNIHYVRKDDLTGDFGLFDDNGNELFKDTYMNSDRYVKTVYQIVKPSLYLDFDNNPTKNKDLKFYDCFNHINNSLDIKSKAQSNAEQSDSSDCPCGVLCFKNNFFYNFPECKQKLHLPKPTMPYQYIGNNTQLTDKEWLENNDWTLGFVFLCVKMCVCFLSVFRCLFFFVCNLDFME